MCYFVYCSSELSYFNFVSILSMFGILNSSSSCRYCTGNGLFWTASVDHTGLVKVCQHLKAFCQKLTAIRTGIRTYQDQMM